VSSCLNGTLSLEAATCSWVVIFIKPLKWSLAFITGLVSGSKLEKGKRYTLPGENIFVLTNNETG
jgi:hypothetical protein